MRNYLFSNRKSSSTFLKDFADMSLEDGAFAKHLMTPEVLMTVVCALTVIIITRPLTLIILAFIFCMFYLVLELIRKPDTEKSNIHVYIGHMINSRVSNGKKQSTEITGGDSAQVMVPFNSSNIPKNNQHSKIKQSINTEQQQPKRKQKMSEPSSVKKETEELLQQSGAIQLLSQIYDMTKSLLHDTREVIKKFDQNEGTLKNSTECISTEVAALQKQKESQTLLPDNLSNGKDPESLKGIPACINDRNSHGSHSTSTLDSKADEQIKDYVDVPKEIPPLLKNNSLRRITYDFNEIQSPTASNTNNGSNNSTSLALLTCLLLLKSGNEATTDKKTIYIHKKKNIFQRDFKNIGCNMGNESTNTNKGFILTETIPPFSSTPAKKKVSDYCMNKKFP